MFGFFKKQQNIGKQIDEVVEVLGLLTQHDKDLVAKNLITFCRKLNEECNTLEEALAHVIALKHAVAIQYNLKDHRHPFYMQVGVILEVLIHCSGHTSVERYALDTLDKVLLPLSNSERANIYRWLEKFTPLNRG